MAELLLLMNKVKDILTGLMFTGWFAAFDLEIFQTVVYDALKDSPAATRIVMVLTIIFTLLRMGWFIVDKWLIYKERTQEMRHKDEDQELELKNK